tara:strand:- start:149 stop:409 length:261 start_codon:yes stop_codon:yes gene_type:complete
MKTVKQDFEVGDLVEFNVPYSSKNKNTKSRIGVITESKLINDSIITEGQFKWHLDEYHCRIKMLGGDLQWVRAKFLKIISKAKNKI